MTVYNRKMFRKGGMSKQPMGILASSPELMTTAEKAMMKGQPIKAQSGASVNYMPQLNLVPGKNRKTPYGGYETVPASRVNLSPTGADYQRGIVDLFGKDQTRFGKTALEQLAQTESAIGRQMGPFEKRQPLSNLDVEGGDVSKPNLAVGIANADDTNSINTSINNILDKYKDVKDPDVEDISEDVETLKTEENKKKTKITSSKIKSPSSADDLIEKLDISPSSEKQGDGAEIKGKTKANVNKEEAKVKYNKYSSLMKQYLDKNDDENAANSTLKAHGFNNKDIGEMSAKEKVDEVRNIITEVMGTKDPSKDQGLEDDLKAMNIVMLGLSIAAGESPNALTNIANGAKDYVLRRSKQIKEKRDEEKQLDLLALKTVLGREEKQEDRKHQKEMAANTRKHDLTLFSKKNAFEMSKLAAQHNFQDHINTVNNTLKLKLDDKQTQRHALGLKTQIITLTENLKNKTEIANAQLQQAGDIANMNNETKLLIAENQLESQELRTIIGNLPEGYGFAMIEGKKKGLEGDDLVNYAKEKGQIFAKNPYLTGPDSFRRMVINVVPKIMKEDGVTFEKALENLTKSLKGNTEILKYFPELEKQKIEEMTKNIQTNKPKTVGDLGLNANPGDVLGQDGKPYTGTGPKFIVQNDGTVVKG